MNLDDARKYLRIDQSLLLVECADQAIHQEEIHRAYVAACSRRDQLKIELESTTGQVSEELRSQKDDNGKAYSGERISFLVHCDPTVIAKKTQLTKAVTEAAQWQALVDAMQARRSMLSNLTSLILQGVSAAAPAASATDAYHIQRRRLAQSRE